MPMFLFETRDPHIPSHSATAPALINAMMAGSYTPHKRFCPGASGRSRPHGKIDRKRAQPPQRERETDTHSSPGPFHAGTIGAGSALKSTRLPPNDFIPSNLVELRAPCHDLVFIADELWGSMAGNSAAQTTYAHACSYAQFVSGQRRETSGSDGWAVS
jgi:hypothetical protein